MTELHEILYCSVLAPDQSANIVGQIVTRARARNDELKISGVLVFDGLRFCQHLEGPRHEVTGLMDRIGQDPRHVDVRVVYDGQPPERRYRRFEVGYADSEQADHLAEIHELEGVAALERFLALRSGFDVIG